MQSGQLGLPGVPRTNFCLSDAAATPRQIEPKATGGDPISVAGYVGAQVRSHGSLLRRWRSFLFLQRAQSPPKLAG
jgi:hypothetical protein